MCMVYIFKNYSDIYVDNDYKYDNDVVDEVVGSF